MHERYAGTGALQTVGRLDTEKPAADDDGSGIAVFC
jgi:hypothetical protein